MRKFRFIACSSLFFLSIAVVPALSRGAERPFAIHVIDEQTGRGVPMVELTTVSHDRFITDSAGFAAVDDPLLLGRKVYFEVRSPGYVFPKDGLGFTGASVETKSGGSVKWRIKRTNIAERLYRITGEGIYRDSVILGKSAPIREPLLAGGVVGQDSAQVAVYRGQIHWFWGDTMRQGYPLGQFWTSGAISQLPSGGGLDPAEGIDLSYFTDPTGFSRPMIDHRDNDPLWIEGLTVIKDEKNVDRLVGTSSKIRKLGECVGRELVIYDDPAEKFVHLADVPLDAPLYPRGHSFNLKSDGIDFVYFGDAYPTIRVKADLRAVCDVSRYEAFTPLIAGSRVKKEATQFPLDRGTGNSVDWAWKRDTATLDPEQQERLIASGKLGPEQSPFNLLDAQTKKRIVIHRGSVCWNEFRRRWILIGVQIGGDSSFLGEVWYAEATRPQGPWQSAVKIVTHDRYSFYNPVQHPFFDQAGGRFIYFEGTYSTTFSRDGDPTPRYDYNQIMYRLDLNDERLKAAE